LGFYPISILSIVPIGIAYAVLGLAFGAMVYVGLPKSILAAAAAAFLVLPISEELWIAWNFGRACKEAGEFVHRKVQVDGFYDDTTHWWRQLQDSGYQPETRYQFVESREPGTNKVWRVERSPEGLKHFEIGRPSARYHFRSTDPMNGTPWAHKIVRSGSVVLDTANNQEVARYTRFGRAAPWFYVGLGTPAFGCDAPGDWPNSRKSFLIYREALIPAGQGQGASR
jgi:hypothetical protein